MLGTKQNLQFSFLRFSIAHRFRQYELSLYSILYAARERLEQLRILMKNKRPIEAFQADIFPRVSAQHPTVEVVAVVVKRQSR